MADLADDLIDRALSAADSAPDLEELLFEIPSFLAILANDRRLRILVEALAHEADDLGLTWATTREQTADLETLRRLEHAVRREARSDVASLDAACALLDEPVSEVVVGLLSSMTSDGSRVGRVVQVLEGRRDQLSVQEARQLEAISARSRARQSAILRAAHSHPGVALIRLRLVEALTADTSTACAMSAPRSPGQPPALVVRADAHGRDWTSITGRALSGEGLAEIAGAVELERAIRRSCRRLAGDLRRRVGSTQTRLAIIDRYKARCEWHDRERLWELADLAVGRRESALRDDLARYLFDAGLDPLSEARLGVTRADVYAPAANGGFLVEAKQYTDGTGLPAALRQGFRQALDTAARAKVGGHGVHEAFVILFRRGGPRAVLPSEPFVADGLAWHLRIVDIAPSHAAGSQNAHTPREWTADQLRELVIDAGADLRKAGAGPLVADLATTHDPEPMG